MLKALRTSASIFRTFSGTSKRFLKNFKAEVLVAQPAKLQKVITFGKNPQWLHQDIKIGQKIIRNQLDSSQTSSLAKQLYLNTRINSPNNNIDRFCNECIIRLGAENFKRFVEFNEHHCQNLVSISDFESFISICLNIFNNDPFLIRLLVMCDLKSINKSIFEKTLSEGAVGADGNKNNDMQHIYKMIPNEKLLYNSYNNIESKGVEGEKMEKVENKNDEITSEDISEISQRKHIIDSFITIHQLPSEKPKKTNWVYFQLESGYDEMLNEKRVMSTFNKFGIKSCQNLLIFKEKNSIRKFNMDSTQISSEDIKNSLGNDIDFGRFSTLAKRLSPSKEYEVDDQALSGDFSSFTSELEKDTFKFTEMIEFCRKINLPNQAYGFAEFKTYEEKERLLNRLFRLFGVEYERAFLVVDDADHKKTIKIDGMWNLNPKSITDWLNKIATTRNIKMKFGLEPGLENFLMDSSCIYLKFNSFPEAMSMMKIINTCEYTTRNVKAAFKRECVRFVNKELNEDYVSDYMRKQQKIHIENQTRKKEAYMKKIGDRFYQKFNVGMTP